MRFDDLLTPQVRERMTQIARQLRQEATAGESSLWTQLRNRRTGGAKFRRQQPIGPFVADFYCDEAALVIEVDGPTHRDQADADANRDEVLGELGLRTLRISSDQVENDLPAVLRKIEAALSESPLPLGEGSG